MTASISTTRKELRHIQCMERKEKAISGGTANEDSLLTGYPGPAATLVTHVCAGRTAGRSISPIRAMPCHDACP